MILDNIVGSILESIVIDIMTYLLSMMVNNCRLVLMWLLSWDRRRHHSQGLSIRCFHHGLLLLLFWLMMMILVCWLLLLMIASLNIPLTLLFCIGIGHRNIVLCHRGAYIIVWLLCLICSVIPEQWLLLR